MRFTLTAVFAASLAQRPQGFAAPGFGSLHNRSRALLSSARATSRSVSDFTTSELKRLLSERNIDFRDCLEKSELVARLQAALRGDLGDPDEGSASASLSEGERNTVRLFERVAPSVAFIQTSTVRSAGPLSLRGEIVPQGSGSGFVWDDEGHVVTNYHVIQQV
jgi:S1-C subfamily serine protease